eukprot:TRINITY_DN25123_c0_g1_i1.p1 TRINITY_DN25123_c0_g1~~TRINITY_DN25123_c0_g1_i1.p1  ORF type:complete len:379 (-),score=69.36 TRINITY_DN25123_c0_g1_i1:104-1240(-)
MVATPSKEEAVEAAASIQVQRIDGSIFKSAIAETQGPRPTHEDAYAVKLRGRSAFFWVFDGHRGDAAARFAANEFSHQNFGLESEELPSDKRIIRTFQAVDRRLKDHLSKKDSEKAGSTAVGALTMRCQDGTYSAKLVNCGDSRGLVIRAPSERREKATNMSVKLPESLEDIADNAKQSWSEGTSWLPEWPAVVETIDHKPNQWGERTRIEAAGGKVLGGKRCARIDGNLAVSRGLGDFDFKDNNRRPAAQQKVSNVPDIYEVHGMPAGTLLLLACDGLWDVMGSEEVASFVQERLQGSRPSSIPSIARELVSHSLEAETTDNVTVLLVQLGDATNDGPAADISRCLEFSSTSQTTVNDTFSDESTSEGENSNSSDDG